MESKIRDDFDPDRRRFVLRCALFSMLAAGSSPVSLLAQDPAGATVSAILHASDAAKVLPDAVFFRGQSATVQARNSGGVKFADGMYTLCVLVDTSGYSSAVQQKYQAYFITEVPLDVNGHALQPGAYGVGFQDGDHFLVMDIGAHDLFTTNGAHDAELKRPTPLQVLADSAADHYRLYMGRNYVVFFRTAE